jgi:hypothetical protein
MEAETEPNIVHLVFGPPGTGKTRYLTTKVREIVSAYGPDSLVVASFSVTAAQEIASRGLGLPPRAVGTLHSLAYRSIGHDQSVALDPDVLKGWNSEVGQEWKITADTRRKAPQSATEGGAQNTDSATASSGDELLASLDRARSTFTDPSNYEPQLAMFAKAWEDWKDRAGAIDYCMDEQTEVFTARGWLTGRDVREGDLVRSINPETGLAEWQPVESVYRRDGITPMVHMVNSVHDSMTTPDHRWLINKRDSRENWTRKWATTLELNSTARIPRAVPSADAPTEAKYLDAFVELAAWWFTEGSYATGLNGGQIGQSHRVNPAYCVRIEAALRCVAGKPGLRENGRVTWSTSRSEKRGMNFYLLGRNLVDQLDMVAPDKVPTIEFLTQLTSAQLRLFVDTAMDADGHRRAQAHVFGQADLRRTEAFAIAAILDGRAVTFAAPRPMGAGSYHEVTISTRRTQAVVPGTTSGFATGSREMIEYEGLIWCPTVAKHHNFLARRSGKTYYPWRRNSRWNGASAPSRW